MRNRLVKPKQGLKDAVKFPNFVEDQANGFTAIRILLRAFTGLTKPAGALTTRSPCGLSHDGAASEHLPK